MTISLAHTMFAAEVCSHCGCLAPQSATTLDDQIRTAAQQQVLTQPCVHSREAARLLALGGTDPTRAVNRLRRRGALIGVPVGRGYLYPAHQFDLPHQRVHPIVAEVNGLLDAAHDPWGAASWWVSPNPRLAGRTPAALIGTTRAPDLRILAASLASD